MTEFLNLLELEAMARGRLDRNAADYFAGGACDEITLTENRRLLDAIRVYYRVLVDVSALDPSVSLLGRRYSAPILVAPMAFHRLAHPDGELATARAAASLGLPLVLSTFATASIEQVRAASTGPLWFQLYVHKDRGLTRSLVERAESAGYEALVLTVDVPMLGRRERDLRNAFQLPPELRLANLGPDGVASLPDAKGDSALAAYFAGLHDSSLTWKDVDWLRSLTRLPLLLKGIVRADDARRAVEHGAAGVIVSNHGGRQLDTAVASIVALPPIAEAVGDRVPVLVDGGIRRGTDIIKAIALGADAVLLGRPVLWGLALDGEAGARRVLELLRDELLQAMALTGAATTSAITAELLVSDA
jgi:4-hydroxymandelate oxidase